MQNTLLSISDNKIGVDANADNTADFYEARVLSATDYYAFGMAMKERSWQSEKYRYGFNGKENDSDWEVQDYGFRIYKPELGKFLSVDPLTQSYPWYTPYQFAGNMPIIAIDLDGAEPQVKIIPKMEHKPFLKAKSVGEAFSNGIHNTIAVPANIVVDVVWNGPATLVNASINLAYGKYNDVNGSLLLMQLNSEVGRQMDGLAKKDASQHWEDFKDAATNLQNYETAGSISLGFRLTTPKVKISSPSSLQSKFRQSIRNKMPNDRQINPVGIPEGGMEGVSSYWKVKGIEIKDGLVLKNGKPYSGQGDYVITESGEFHIGKGHGYLSDNPNSVQAAGGIKIVNGKVMYHNDHTGHFAPSTVELQGNHQLLKEKGITTDNTIQTKLY